MAKSPFLRMGIFSRLVKDFRLLAALSKDYWNGSYRDVSITGILVFVAAIIYVISPVDVIADYLPILGQIDDALVLLACLYVLEKDLYKYQEWKQQHMSKPPN